MLKNNKPQSQKGPRLTFSDGLNFGAGFWLAGLLLFGAGGLCWLVIIAIGATMASG